MKILPQYRVFMHPSLLPDINTGEEVLPLVLNWYLEHFALLPNRPPVYYYLCREGMYACGDEKRCKTTEFMGSDIPESVLDYMKKFTETFAVGVAWANSKKQK
jgi:hypothetical protein